MQRRKLGTSGPEVSAIGLGCMSFAGFFGATDEAQSHRCLDAARDRGIDFLDTSNIYGMGRSESVIGSWLASRKPEGMVIATKAGIITRPERRFDNSEDHLRRELEGSLRRLGRDHVELFYLHRRDQSIPVEEAVGTLSRLVEEGKIGGYGLSEVSPATLRRAHAVHPCLAVQNEYSLWSRQPELGLIRTCAELGVAFVPFSPLGRGVFTEAFPDTAAMEDTDFRKRLPRFVEPGYGFNRALIARFKDFAHARGLTVAGAAMAWVLSRGPHLIPIPGTRSAEHLAEWVDACEIAFGPDEIAAIEELLPAGFAHGDRYNDGQIIGVERYC